MVPRLPAPRRVEAKVVHRGGQTRLEPAETCWPELPALPMVAAASFTWPGAGRVKEIMDYEPAAANDWPVLAESSAKLEAGWRALLRSVERSQRLEREQRGY